jgi:hypothetical protein
MVVGGDCGHRRQTGDQLVIKARRNMFILPISSLCPLKLPQRDARKE